MLAGNTAYLRDKNLPNSKFWKWASKNYREAFLVPGNYEYYGFSDVLENVSGNLEEVNEYLDRMD